jgi:hypothetical protein
VAARCAFCGATGNRSGEHLWSAWLRTLLRDQDAALPHRAMSTIESSDERSWIAPPFTIRVNRVCATCNNGWMSELESVAKPILTPLVLGQKTVLDKHAQKVAAVWATKTAMVFQLATKHRSIKRSQFHYLRTHLRPPPSAQVWLGCRTADEPKPGLFGFRSSGLAPEGETQPRFDAYLVTIGIGHFVAQVYGHDLPFDSIWARRGEFADALVQVWPLAEDEVVWPRTNLISSITNLSEDRAFEEELTAILAGRGIHVLTFDPRRLGAT